MVIACLLNILIQGEFEEHIITGQVIKAQPGYYVADFQNSVDGLHGTGNYVRFIVPEDRCTVLEYKKPKVP